jgi:hypothetical protein
VVANRSHYFFKKSNFVFSHLTLFPICTLTDYGKNQNNRFLCDVHVDRNPSEGLIQEIFLMKRRMRSRASFKTS